MNIEIYTTTTCPYCVRAKAWLSERGYEYKEILLNEPAARAQFKQNHPGLNTVPQVFADGELIGGFSDLAGSKLDRS